MPSATTQSSETPRELIVDGKVVGRQVEARPGEVCLICRLLIATDDLVYLVEGQRVPVHRADCVHRLLSNPQDGWPG